MRERVIILPLCACVCEGRGEEAGLEAVSQADGRAQQRTGRTEGDVVHCMRGE